MLVVRLEQAGMLAQCVDVARGAQGSTALVALPAAADNDAEAQAAWAVQAGGRLLVCVSAASRQCGVEVVGRERRILHQRRSGRARPSCGLAASDARREPCAALVAEWARGS
jgi:hypothetical protein